MDWSGRRRGGLGAALCPCGDRQDQRVQGGKRSDQRAFRHHPKGRHGVPLSGIQGPGPLRPSGGGPAGLQDQRAQCGVFRERRPLQRPDGLRGHEGGHQGQRQDRLRRLPGHELRPADRLHRRQRHGHDGGGRGHPGHRGHVRLLRRRQRHRQLRLRRQLHRPLRPGGRGHLHQGGGRGG